MDLTTFNFPLKHFVCTYICFLCINPAHRTYKQATPVFDIANRIILAIHPFDLPLVRFLIRSGNPGVHVIVTPRVGLPIRSEQVLIVVHVHDSVVAITSEDFPLLRALPVRDMSMFCVVLLGRGQVVAVVPVPEGNTTGGDVC
uniref:(northern house mosquito) hypothetical protein n=1 Tax=Culex pipiens TaxID=7175 RepID=A0A8D8HG86_CULPI